MSKKAESSRGHWELYWLGILAGSLITFVMMFVFRGEVFPGWKSVAFFLSGSTILVSISLLIMVRYRDGIFLRFFKQKVSTFEDVSDNLFNATRALAKEDTASAIENAKRAFSAATTLYGWVALRGWIASVFVALSAIYVGGIGTILLLEQNARIQSQNEITADQRELTELGFLLKEGERRGFLTPLLIDTISMIQSLEYSDPEKSYFQLKARRTSDQNAKISSLVNLMQPYWYFDTIHQQRISSANTTWSRSLPTRTILDSENRIVFGSPERGLIMQALLSQGIDISNLFFYRLGLATLDFKFTDARDLTLGLVPNAIVAKKTPIIGALQDIKLCAESDVPGLREVFPRLDPTAASHIDLSGSRLEFIEVSTDETFILEGAILKEAVFDVLTGSQLRHLGSIATTEGVQFRTSFEMLPALVEYIKYGHATPKGISDEEYASLTKQHLGNCLILELDQLNSEVFEDVGRSADIWTERTLNELGEILELNRQQVLNRFEVFHPPLVNGEVALNGRIFVRRRDYYVG